jgi:hypothetical protein
MSDGGLMSTFPLMELPAWDYRNSVTAAMLNPALIATVLAGAAESHAHRSGDPMPWEYCFLVAPLVLHRETRQALPSRVDSHVDKWVIDHPVLVSGLPARATQLVPYVREGLRFGVRSGAIAFESDGTIVGRIKSSPVTLSRSPDLGSIVRGAGFVGRWLTSTNSPSGVFSLFGVSP